MAFVHGKGVVVTIDGDDISAFTKNVEFSREADTHDTTTFGKNSKTYAAGLKDGTATMEGVYDNTADTGPGAVLKPLLGGAAVELIYQPEGLGAGKAQSIVDVIVNSYEESAPVDDMITWTAEVQCTDDIDDTPQAGP